MLWSYGAKWGVKWDVSSSSYKSEVVALAGGDCNRPALNREAISPGGGWRKLEGPVYEHKNGTRIHWAGRLVMTPDGDIKILTAYEEKVLDFFIKANGGNKKRGIMAFAKNLSESQS